jgi:pimeloyl-ACP methyl ester carboxylesterase
VTDLYVEEIGAGPRVVLVHGSGAIGGARSWSEQLVLADRYRLVIPDRRGYGRSPTGAPSFERDAVDVAELLGEGAHLVGQSYGGVASLLAAARRPAAVRTLVVCEPPAFSIARGIPAVDAIVERLSAVYEAAPSLTPEEFDGRFRAALGFPTEQVDRLDPDVRRVVGAMMRERPPWLASLPTARLARMSCPKLVVSGDWSEAFHAVCDAIANAIGAEHHVMVGFGSHGLPWAPGFNGVLQRVWAAA